MHLSIPAPRHGDCRRTAFTLIELLVTIATIAVLAALLLPVTSYMRKQGDSAQCLAQLRQIGTGIAGYTNDHDNRLPGPLSFKQSATYNANSTGSLAQMLENYLGTARPTAAQGSDLLSPALLCPAAARKLNSQTIATYCMNLLAVPDYQQAPWGDVSSNVPPLTQAALAHWTDGQTQSRTLFLADVWAVQDADQYYARNDASFSTGPVNDLLPLPAHDDHYNALFFDYHVSRRVAITVTLPTGGNGTPAPTAAP